MYKCPATAGIKEREKVNSILKLGPSIEELIAHGYGRSMTVGGFSTGIVGGGAGTILDLDQPEFIVSVPPGLCIRPIYVEIVVQPGVTTADSDETEALLAVDSLSYMRVAPTPTGASVTQTDETPTNMRTDLAQGSQCRCASAFVVDMETVNAQGTSADPVLDMELARNLELTDFNASAVSIAFHVVRLVYQPKFPPFLVGPCTLLGYWGGTIATVGGYAIVQWVEGPTALLLPAIAGL